MLVKCSVCGKFFGAESNSETVCSACNRGPLQKYDAIDDIEQRKFKAARDLVYEVPEISPGDVVDRLAEMGIEITSKEIMGYVRDGRLTLVNNPGSKYCEDCGRVILSGRLCPKCSSNLEKNITSKNTTTKVVSTVVVENERKSGMHTADVKRKK